jgi:hypothetical protein
LKKSIVKLHSVVLRELDVIPARESLKKTPLRVPPLLRVFLSRKITRRKGETRRGEDKNLLFRGSLVKFHIEDTEGHGE